jgi:type IV pilus assembly protein PilC
MGETHLFDDLVVNMVDVGEATGELDRMLLKVADAYEVQVDRRVEALFKVIEPLLLILMAVVVGFIVIALFLPLTEIMGSIGQG